MAVRNIGEKGNVLSTMNREQKSRIRALIKFILAYVSSVAVGIFTGYGITRIDIGLPLLCIIFYFVYDAVDAMLISRMRFADYMAERTVLEDLKHSDIRKELIFTLPPAFIFSLSVTLGRHIDVWEDSITSWKLHDFVILLLLTVLFAFLLLVLYKTTDRKCNAEGIALKNEKVRPLHVICVGGIFLICWLPYYLTLFPGNLGKDTFESADMVLGNIAWTNHHPIFFTALLACIFKLTGWMGNITASFAVFTFLHMIAVALTLGYITMWMKKRGSGLYTALFFALHPIVAMYSIYITKDVLFSCVMALLVLKLTDYADMMHSQEEGEKGLRLYVSIAVLMLFTMLLRNNGIYIIILLGLIVLAVYRQDVTKLFPVLLIPIVVFVLFRSIAYKGLDIQPESFAESASIPLQQVGYVIREHTDEELAQSLTGEDEEILNSIMPYERVREVYELGYADTYKFDPEFDDKYFNEHRKEFIRIWLRLMPEYFTDYTKAYLAETAGYWHYGETNTVATQGVWEDNTLGVARIDIIENVTGMSLYGIIEKLMLGMRKAPILCILSSMAMEFYGVLLAICVILRAGARHEVTTCSNKKSLYHIMALMPLVLLWLSVMAAAPAFCLFRYMYPMFILWPVTLHMILNYSTVCGKDISGCHSVQNYIE